MDSKVSVLIKKNWEEQAMVTSRIVSGSEGEFADTEFGGPVLCVKDLIDELEKKVPSKYKKELDEIEGLVKLKAGENK